MWYTSKYGITNDFNFKICYKCYKWHSTQNNITQTASVVMGCKNFNRYVPFSFIPVSHEKPYVQLYTVADASHISENGNTTIDAKDNHVLFHHFWQTVVLAASGYYRLKSVDKIDAWSVFRSLTQHSQPLKQHCETEVGAGNLLISL